MSMKHTPGPWKIAGEHADRQTFIYALNKRGTNRFWFDIQSGLTDDKQRTSVAELSANARLIAAAPELLDALKDCIQLMKLDLECLAFVQPELKKAMAAIEKATGEQA